MFNDKELVEPLELIQNGNNLILTNEIAKKKNKKKTNTKMKKRLNKSYTDYNLDLPSKIMIDEKEKTQIPIEKINPLTVKNEIQTINKKTGYKFINHDMEKRLEQVAKDYNLKLPRKNIKRKKKLNKKNKIENYYSEITLSSFNSNSLDDEKNSQILNQSNFLSPNTTPIEANNETKISNKSDNQNNQGETKSINDDQFILAKIIPMANNNETIVTETPIIINQNSHIQSLKSLKSASNNKEQSNLTNNTKISNQIKISPIDDFQIEIKNKDKDQLKNSFIFSNNTLITNNNDNETIFINPFIKSNEITDTNINETIQNESLNNKQSLQIVGTADDCNLQSSATTSSKKRSNSNNKIKISNQGKIIPIDGNQNFQIEIKNKDKVQPNNPFILVANNTQITNENEITAQSNYETPIILSQNSQNKSLNNTNLIKPVSSNKKRSNSNKTKIPNQRKISPIDNFHNKDQFKNPFIFLNNNQITNDNETKFTNSFIKTNEITVKSNVETKIIINQNTQNEMLNMQPIEPASDKKENNLAEISNRNQKSQININHNSLSEIESTDKIKYNPFISSKKSQIDNENLEKKRIDKPTIQFVKTNIITVTSNDKTIIKETPQNSQNESLNNAQSIKPASNSKKQSNLNKKTYISNRNLKNIQENKINPQIFIPITNNNTDINYNNESNI
jgi:hypothetical protein